MAITDYRHVEFECAPCPDTGGVRWTLHWVTSGGGARNMYGRAPCQKGAKRDALKRAQWDSAPPFVIFYLEGKRQKAHPAPRKKHVFRAQFTHGGIGQICKGMFWGDRITSGLALLYKKGK